MSDAGDPLGPRKPHSPNYQSLNVEHSLEDAPPPQQAEAAAAPQLSNIEKTDAAETLRNEEMVRFRDERPRSQNETNDHSRKIDKLDYKELTELAEAKRAAAEQMQQRTPPDAPDEPTEPHTYSKSR
jgi:hypothetical protein